MLVAQLPAGSLKGLGHGHLHSWSLYSLVEISQNTGFAVELFSIPDYRNCFCF